MLGYSDEPLQWNGISTHYRVPKMDLIIGMGDRQIVDKCPAAKMEHPTHLYQWAVLFDVSPNLFQPSISS